MRPINFARLKVSITALYRNYYQRVQDLLQIENI